MTSFFANFSRNLAYSFKKDASPLPFGAEAPSYHVVQALAIPPPFLGLALPICRHR